MEKKLYLTILYEYYKDLLTEKQKEYFEDYYFDNLTLSEIASNNDVSRNAIHKQIKDVESKLLEYEEKLKLYEKSEKINKLIENIDERIREEIKELI